MTRLTDNPAPVLTIERIDPGPHTARSKDLAYLTKRFSASLQRPRSDIRPHLEKPAHEFALVFVVSDRDFRPGDEGIRVFGHELGQVSVCSVWQGSRLLYHLAVVHLPDQTWEQIVAIAVERWLTTGPHAMNELPSECRSFVATRAGSGKTIGMRRQ